MKIFTIRNRQGIVTDIVVVREAQQHQYRILNLLTGELISSHYTSFEEAEYSIYKENAVLQVREGEYLWQ